MKYRHAEGNPDYGVEVTLDLEAGGRFRLEVEWTDIFVGGPDGPFEKTVVDVFRGSVEGSGDRLTLATEDVERLPEAAALEPGERRMPFPGPRTPSTLRFPVVRLGDGAIGLGQPEGGARCLLPWSMVLRPIATERFRPAPPS